MFDIPSDCTFATSKSNGDFNSRDLYIKSLEESALARNYMTNTPMTAPAPTPVIDAMTTLRLDMDAQQKQFELLLKQDLDLIAAFTKVSVSPNPGSGATPKLRCTGCKHVRAHLKKCPNCKKMCTHKPDGCYSLAVNADKCPTNYKATSST
jgi:hypothetical protein